MVTFIPLAAPDYQVVDRDDGYTVQIVAKGNDSETYRRR
jgi:lipocalin